MPSVQFWICISSWGAPWLKVGGFGHRRRLLPSVSRSPGLSAACLSVFFVFLQVWTLKIPITCLPAAPAKGWPRSPGFWHCLSALCTLAGGGWAWEWAAAAPASAPRSGLSGPSSTSPASQTPGGRRGTWWAGELVNLHECRSCLSPSAGNPSSLSSCFDIEPQPPCFSLAAVSSSPPLHLSKQKGRSTVMI